KGARRSGQYSGVPRTAAAAARPFAIGCRAAADSGWEKRAAAPQSSPNARDVTMALSDIEIAQRANMKRIVEVAAKLGIPEEYLEPYGHYKAKVSLDYVASLGDRPDGKLILVTAMSPTPAGEGKTTTTVG